MKLSARNQVKGRIMGHVRTGNGATLHPPAASGAVGGLAPETGGGCGVRHQGPGRDGRQARGTPTRAGRIALAFGFAVLACLGAAPSRAAGPAPGNAAPGPAADAGIAVGGAGREMTLTTAALAALPSVQVPVPAGTAPDARARTFEGPLLWTVLAHAGAVDPSKHGGDVRGTVVLTGRDGYTAVLALGELSPEFENKQVIVALRLDGQPLEPERLRVVVPGDKRGGRGVHDLVRIGVAAAASAPQHAAH